MWNDRYALGVGLGAWHFLSPLSCVFSSLGVAVDPLSMVRPSPLCLSAFSLSSCAENPLKGATILPSKPGAAAPSPQPKIPNFHLVWMVRLHLIPLPEWCSCQSFSLMVRPSSFLFLPFSFIFFLDQRDSSLKKKTNQPSYLPFQNVGSLNSMCCPIHLSKTIRSFSTTQHFFSFLTCWKFPFQNHVFSLHSSAFFPVDSTDMERPLTSLNMNLPFVYIHVEFSSSKVRVFPRESIAAWGPSCKIK